ncbi:MAG: hypothetical protein GY714_23985 [Desulfobacterales bacterium]|nr:hypothetical protein [Desulfobacterales bacterium]MCP4163594.1 hypothetical protein [Deltaproteobacteria bacterium]
MKLTKRKFIKITIILFVLSIITVFVFPFCVYKYFNYFADQYMFSNLEDVPKSHTALVLGARVFRDKRISYILYDRVSSGIKLYKNGKVSKFLLSGDHGRKEYDEVNTMKYHVQNSKIDPKDIFLDHAGFDTYDSVIRAKKVFGVKEVVIVTQRFHLPRAIFIARKNGLKAFGYIADKRRYPAIRYYKFREMYARVKALIEVCIGANPKFLGDKISIYGDSKLSWDIK